MTKKKKQNKEIEKIKQDDPMYTQSAVTILLAIKINELIDAVNTLNKDH